MSDDKICSVFYSSRREAAKRAAIWRAAAKAGMRPARIARAFGVTRQAVSKVLHSAPRSKVRLPSRAPSHYAGGENKSTTDLERVKASEARLREALKEIVVVIDVASEEVGRGFGTDVIRSISFTARDALAAR